MTRKKHNVIQRTDMLNASLKLNRTTIGLEGYTSTGLMAVAVGPRGKGKTNAGLVIGEQLSRQGWISVLVDPEGELESLYGDAVTDAEELRERLLKRDKPIVVVSAANAEEFIPYGRAILEVSDRDRKPIFAMIDEGQIFSAARKRKGGMGESGDILKDFGEKGRKRALDVFITAHRFTGSVDRSIFSNKNLTFIGRQEDPTAWSTLAPMFRKSKIEFSDLAALETGEFFCFSNRGLEKIRMPLADALKGVAIKAKSVKPAMPTTFSQWDRALCEMPTERLEALSDDVVSLLGSVAGLSGQQMLSGSRALRDELESRK
jgi:hypothetical protein